jgi:hypothetical protein
MSTSEFKRLFNKLAQSHRWLSGNGGWLYPRTDEDQCTVAIELQKSAYGKLFYVGINIYIDNAFGCVFVSENSIQNQVATLYRRHPKELNPVFDLTNSLGDSARNDGLGQFFRFAGELAEIARMRRGVVDLAKDGKLFVAPGVRTEIDRLTAANNS